MSMFDREADVRLKNIEILTHRILKIGEVLLEEKGLKLDFITGEIMELEEQQEEPPKTFKAKNKEVKP